LSVIVVLLMWFCEIKQNDTKMRSAFSTRVIQMMSG
jgi:hypothetical protein